MSHLATWLEFGSTAALSGRPRERRPFAPTGGAVRSADDEPTRLAAAEILASLATPDGETKDRLMTLLKAAPSITCIASSLYALGCGWADDADVGELAAEAARAPEPSVCNGGHPNPRKAERHG